MALQWLAYEIVIPLWLTLAASFPFLACRLYVRIYRYGPLNQWKTYRSSDLFVILAWALWTTDCALQTPYYRMLRYIFDGHQDVPAKYPEWFFPAMSYVHHLWYGHTILFRLVVYAIKAALLCFYQELSPRRNNFRIWVLIMVSWFFLAAGAITFLGYKLFMCRPMKGYWSPISKEPPYQVTSTCGVAGHYIVVVESWNLFTSLMVYAIPFFILASIRRQSSYRKLKGRRLIVPVIMFSLGIPNVCVSTALLAFNIMNKTIITNSAAQYANAWLNFTAALIVCVPYVRRTYVDFKAWQGRGRRKMSRKFSSDVRSTVVGRTRPFFHKTHADVEEKAVAETTTGVTEEKTTEKEIEMVRSRTLV